MYKGHGLCGVRCFMRSIHQNDRRHAYGWWNDGIAIRSKVWTHVDLVVHSDTDRSCKILCTEIGTYSERDCVRRVTAMGNLLFLTR